MLDAGIEDELMRTVADTINKTAPGSVPAGTPLEEAIAAIWREVLGVASVVGTQIFSISAATRCSSDGLIRN